MTITVLIYQMDVQFGKPKENITKIERVMKDHYEESKDSKLLVLPELFLTGYHAKSIEKLTSENETAEFKKLLELSEKYNYTIFGSIPKRFKGEPYNTAILIDKGKLLGEYRKSHLFGPMGEKELFRQGTEVSTFDLDKIKLGPSICYDLRFPELYRRMRSDGAELMLICAEWPIQRIKHWYTLLKARAIENQMTIIACNRVGDDPDYHYGGHSAVIDSYGDVIVSAESDKEIVLECTLDSSSFTKFRNNFDTEIDHWIE